MLWKTSEKSVSECKNILREHENEVDEEKTPLYHELIKLLTEQKSQNREDFPEMYN